MLFFVKRIFLNFFFFLFFNIQMWSMLQYMDLENVISLLVQIQITIVCELIAYNNRWMITKTSCFQKYIIYWCFTLKALATWTLCGGLKCLEPVHI